MKNKVSIYSIVQSLFVQVIIHVKEKTEESIPNTQYNSQLYFNAGKTSRTAGVLYCVFSDWIYKVCNITSAILSTN